MKSTIFIAIVAMLSAAITEAHPATSTEICDRICLPNRPFCPFNEVVGGEPGCYFCCRRIIDWYKAGHCSVGVSCSGIIIISEVRIVLIVTILTLKPAWSLCLLLGIVYRTGHLRQSEAYVTSMEEYVRNWTTFFNSVIAPRFFQVGPINVVHTNQPCDP